MVVGESIGSKMLVASTFSVLLRGDVHVQAVADVCLKIGAFQHWLRAADCLGWVIFFFLVFSIIWLCASLMSRLDLVILLLQRLDVICIFLISIYYPLSKKFMPLQPPVYLVNIGNNILSN
jgi:hypothetical protein